jgi:SAM-dependent methyltransferase
MKKAIGFMLACTVFLAGCDGREPNPTPGHLPGDETSSATALEAPVLDVNNQDVVKQVEQYREPDVVFVPTPYDVVDKMLELAQVQKDDLVYDLGCGDGRIVVAAAKKYGCKAVGFDIDPERVQESLDNVASSNVGHLVRIEQKDIFTLDLSKASVITLYLLPELNVKLIPQLQKLKPGSRIVSHDFRMRGVKPDKVIELTSGDDSRGHKVFLWTTPLKITEGAEAGADDTDPWQGILNESVFEPSATL